MKLKKTKLRLIGRRELIDFPALNLFGIEGKVDTGAYTSSIHVETMMISYEDGKPILHFTLDKEGQQSYRFDDFSQKKIKNSFGEMEERYVIKTVFRIGRKRIRSIISLSNRDNMRFPVLIGRRLLKGKFLIDCKHVHTGGLKIYRAIQNYNSLPVDKHK